MKESFFDHKILWDSNSSSKTFRGLVSFELVVPILKISPVELQKVLFTNKFYNFQAKQEHLKNAET
jgi:hypothetical protein